MTGNEIKALAELHTEDLPIEDNQVLVFINECIFMDLGKDAGVIGSEVITVEKDSWTTIQTSLLDIFEIEKEGQSYPYYGRKYGKPYGGLFDIKDNDADYLSGVNTYANRFGIKATKIICSTLVIVGFTCFYVFNNEPSYLIASILLRLILLVSISK